ncbi:fungal-specific transcription factor domain-containing protein [Lineolata rhizophorae]|uniref:Fungal-specific transcription factor domain-containing protein n=1 Tax=Lineolata rhizophorae TaxID=578093 RepID=A0A6A6NYL8_9PEZI|nr:fungal-specific transcription factor domain-containing protein [Lineolata rhizophorae]
MLTSSESLRYTLLSLAATYVLDYFPNEDIRTRANAYYQRAVALLSDALSQPEEQMIGGGDSLVGTIVVFIMHDTVTWEHRRPKSQVPRWLEGARLASRILDATDPGYRYWHSPENVQSTTAYTSNTVLVARAAILGLLMTPLDPIHTKGQFGWLLHGIERNARKVHGGCGFSPKLLHIFAQITQLASQMALEPSSVILPKGAEYIKSKLANLRQWSELSPETDGYASTEALLDSCVLNEHGVIECPKKMTDLGAEAWRIAAQIYLQCRFFRLPRSHAEVMTNCRRLSECVRRMPCYGPLFTAQAPLFPVFLLGLVSVSEEDFGIARNWFETVLSATSCRSSVPPVWDALKILRIWVDGEITDEPHIDMIPVGQRQPWWEDIVAHATETVGTLCLM